MTLLYNLLGSTNADLIGNDANPTLTIKNTSTGNALSLANTTGVTFTASTSGATSAAVITAQGTGSALIAFGSIGATDARLGAAISATFSANVSGATVAPLNVVASTASQAVMSISGVFISTASINLAANKTAFIIPVYHETQKAWGYVAASIGVS